MYDSYEILSSQRPNVYYILTFTERQCEITVIKRPKMTNIFDKLFFFKRTHRLETNMF